MPGSADKRREKAIAEKLKAREKAHLKGFGGNRFPDSKRDMPMDVAARGLHNLAVAATGVETDQ
ncbi:MAG: hypothetical protein ACR2O0_14280 [Rhizobiaceae bacterium]